MNREGQGGPAAYTGNELSVAVEVERPDRPAIWLDTSALINVAKARNGRPQSDVDRQRSQLLDRIVAEKVGAGRLLCLESEQKYEVRASGQEAVLGALHSLSMGADLNSVLEVRHRQWAAAMSAYLADSRRIELPLRTFFREDPAPAVDGNLGRGWMLTVRMDEHEEVCRHRKESKEDLLQKLEKMRQRAVAEGVTFEQQLELEYLGTWNGIKSLYVTAMSALGTDMQSFWDREGGFALPEVLHIWESAGGQPNDLPEFFRSAYLRALPWEDIECRIYADLVTGREPIKSGDAGDVEHLALVLPVASFVLTDRRMARRVRDLGLDEKWGARVFSLADTKELVSALAAL